MSRASCAPGRPARRQVVVAQGVLVAGAGLLGDLLQAQRGKTSEPKMTGTVALLDLVDDAGDLARLRVLEVRRAGRADDLPAVGLAK
jgi:hypothetical protein